MTLPPLKNRRVFNNSRRWSVEVTFDDRAAVTLEPGYSLPAGARPALTIRCTSRPLRCRDASAPSWSLRDALSDAVVHDDAAGEPALVCAGAKPYASSAPDDPAPETATSAPTSRPEKADSRRVDALRGIAPEPIEPQQVVPVPIAQEVGWVTVLGAGVAGLTAAHELAERGFRVQVVEREHASPLDAGRAPPDAGPDAVAFGLDAPDIGGVARTQWATAVMGDASKEMRSLVPVHGNVDWVRDSLRAAAPTLNVRFSGDDCVGFVEDFKAWWFDSLAGGPRERGDARVGLQLVAAVYECDTAAAPFLGPEAAYARLRALRATILGSDVAPVFQEVGRMPVARAALRLTADEVARIERGEVTLAGAFVRHFEGHELVAGEHGFRFFPGFYRHLRDTMRRTPVLDSTDPDRNVHEHLQEVNWQVIADPTRRRPAAFARRQLPSPASVVEQYQLIRRELGYRPSDMMRFTLRLLRYATSSAERRATCYEALSWWDFLSLRDLRGATTPLTGAPDTRERLHYGRRFASTLRHAPRALVAMDSTVTDARTQGNISIQLAMDQFDLHDSTDSTLQAPTSEAWLRYWRDYLERLGVRFFVGEVTRIRRADGGRTRSAVDIAFPGGAPPAGFFSAEGRAHHYYVCALDLPSAARVCAAWCDGLDARAASLTVPGALPGLAREVGPAAPNTSRDPEDIHKMAATPGDRLQTLTGVQIYFRHRVSFAQGHLYYVFSPWGLSAISQVQYWRPFLGSGAGGLLGNLSVDVGAWRPMPGPGSADDWLREGSAAPWPRGYDSPNARSPRGIARGVYDQVQTCARITPSDGPQPTAFHVDEYIDFEATGATEDTLRPVRNRAPFLINVVGDWAARPPGDPWSPGVKRFREGAPGQGAYLGEVPGSRLVWSRVTHASGPVGYRVHDDDLVFCGAWMRTTTRLGTMEAANESARHAVNALLDHRCAVRPAPPAPHPPVPRGAQLEGLGSFPPRRSAQDVARPENQPLARSTPFGDYCEIWDPEDNESPDLAFIRLVDQKLLQEYAAALRARHVDGGDDVYLPPGAREEPHPPPHLFDRLGVDRLPDLIEDDGEAVAALSEVEALLSTLRDASKSDVDAAARSIEAWRSRFEGLLVKLHQKLSSAGS